MLQPPSPSPTVLPAPPPSQFLACPPSLSFWPAPACTMGSTASPACSCSSQAPTSSLCPACLPACLPAPPPPHQFLASTMGSTASGLLVDNADSAIAYALWLGQAKIQGGFNEIVGFVDQVSQDPCGPGSRIQDPRSTWARIQGLGSM